MPPFNEVMAYTWAQDTLANEAAHQLSIKRRKLAALRRNIADALFGKKRADLQREQVCSCVDALFRNLKELKPSAATQPPQEVISSQQEIEDTPPDNLAMDIHTPETHLLTDVDESRTSEECQTNHDVPHFETSNETYPPTLTIDDLNPVQSDIEDIGVCTPDKFAWYNQVPPTPSSRTIKAKLCKSKPTCVAIETTRKAIPTTSEFAWRERGMTLRGEQTKQFDNWFPPRIPQRPTHSRSTSSGSNTPESLSSAPSPEPRARRNLKRLRSTSCSSDEETLAKSPAFKRRNVSRLKSAGSCPPVRWQAL